ncbi:MAG: MobC family plasmid mobilization relaxosome protein [Lachnospiraceae bacterium]|nr:MobC family plasmid mobilization relaxosome protein [Lachnospiraceae bacterium]
MSQDKLSLVKKFRLSPREATILADKAQQANMTESEYLRLMISQKPSDYSEIRILLKELINEVNHIGTNINQIVHNHNSGIYSEDDKERLVAYMRKLNTEVNNVYKTVNGGKFRNE